jgi:hypothetical protein
VTDTNIAPTGTGYTWSKNTKATSNRYRAASPEINDNNLVHNVDVQPDGDHAGAWEAAGVVFPIAQSIASVSFINGDVTDEGDGYLEANISLQLSTDGDTWTESGWNVTPPYPYTSDAGGQTYAFTGAPVSGVLGARISGQVRTKDGSYHWIMKQVEIFSSSGGGTGNYTPDQVLAGVAANMTPSKKVNSEPHRNSQTHELNVNVYEVADGYFAYTSSMAIDTDGSDPDPDPDHQNQTAWQDDNGDQLGAHHVPYYVLGDVCPDGQSPCRWFYYSEHSITGLQFGLIFYNGLCIGAVFGDTQGPPGGDARELGEASVKSANLLGIPSSGTAGGVDNGVTVVVFSGPEWVVPGTNSSLNDNAQALMQKALNSLGSALGL